MQDKRGFTMLELLICIAIVSSIGMLLLPVMKKPDFSAEYFVIDALKLQSDAMQQREEKSFFVDGIELRYNASGNISQAHTFVFEKGEITAQLGWGRLVEK